MVTNYHMHTIGTIIGSFLLLGCASLVYHSWSILIKIKKVTIFFDENFSTTCTTLLKEKLTYELDQKTHTPATLLSILKTNFNCIETIESHIYEPGYLYYTIIAHAPRFVINNNLVLCDNNQLVPRSWYKSTLCAQLPEIMTAQPVQKGAAPVGLHLLAHRLPRTIFKDYTVTWNNDVETILKYKKDPNFTISCNAHCTADANIYTRCITMCNDIKNKTSCLKNSFGALHADIRFTNQIVIHADLGRAIHG